MTILERDADVELPKELRKLKFNAEPGFDEVDDEREPGDVWEVDWIWFGWIVEDPGEEEMWRIGGIRAGCREEPMSLS